MSYLNKKNRIFYDGEFIYLPHSRSAHRIKKYYSATDLRTWCDSVEQRRQHIIELMARERQCLELYLPLEQILTLGVEGEGAYESGPGNKADSPEKNTLEKRIYYLQKEIDMFEQLPLDNEQKRQVEKLKKKFGLVPPPE